MKGALTTVVAIALVCPAAALAQSEEMLRGVASNYTGRPKADSRAGFLARLPGLSPDYRLGPGDEIEVVAPPLWEVGQAFKISSQGEIVLPFAGTFHAADLTTTDLESQIAQRLRDGDLVREPDVIVHITQFKAKSVHVVGEVDNPGQYVLSQDFTVSEMILLAGGLDITAADYGYLHRKTQPSAPDTPAEGLVSSPTVPEPGREVIRIDLRPLKTGGVIDPELRVRPGDVLVVPSREVRMFYVIGDVVRPGGYELPQSGTLSVSQAISNAGGPMPTAKMSQGLLLRYEGGKRGEVKVDYAAILDGRQTDFVVRPDDVVFIPDSAGKILGYGLIRMIPRVVAQGLLFW